MPKKNGPGVGHLPIQRVLHVGHLTAENKKIQMPGGVPGGGGMLMLQIDRCISSKITRNTLASRVTANIVKGF